MKRILLFLIVFCVSIFSKAQIVKCDTIIKEKCYISYYSYKIKGPSYVVYKLYKGGGNIPRKGMSFKSKLPHFIYPKSNYDIGHMCDAKDFAYNKELEESTFKYYNALPQTPNLNRGIWKKLETQIRKDSQKDSLLIICGGENFNNLIPTYCWKVVYSLSTGKLLYSKEFTNKQNDNTSKDVILPFDFKIMRKIQVNYKRN